MLRSASAADRTASSDMPAQDRSLAIGYYQLLSAASTHVKDFFYVFIFSVVESESYVFHDDGT